LGILHRKREDRACLLFLHAFSVKVFGARRVLTFLIQINFNLLFFSQN
jgi:hypothetical protein